MNPGFQRVVHLSRTGVTRGSWDGAEFREGSWGCEDAVEVPVDGVCTQDRGRKGADQGTGTGEEAESRRELECLSVEAEGKFPGLILGRVSCVSSASGPGPSPRRCLRSSPPSTALASCACSAVPSREPKAEVPWAGPCRSLRGPGPPTLPLSQHCLCSQEQSEVSKGRVLGGAHVLVSPGGRD